MINGIMLYDFLAVSGGAEKLTFSVLNAMPDLSLCCAFRNEAVFPNTALPGAGFVDLRANSNIPVWRILKVMTAFERKTIFLRDYDWVLFSGIFAPLAVRNRSHGANFLYCHTIPRFAYDLKEYYVTRLPFIFRPAFLALVLLMRFRYRQALIKMDGIIANSYNVKNRLEKYLGRTATVIHPPVDIKRFIWMDQKDYYISLARLENFKRVDIIVKAFRQMPEKKLVVTSSGSEFEKLKKLASGAPNIHFTGWQTEEQLRQWIGNAIAAIYIPIDEDFGMSPVEAMASGKPVIGVAEGGLLESVVQNETGFLLQPPPTVDAIISAVNKLTPHRALEMRSTCEKRAKLFSEEIFIEKLRNYLESWGINVSS